MRVCGDFQLCVSSYVPHVCVCKRDKNERERERVNESPMRETDKR